MSDEIQKEQLDTLKEIRASIDALAMGQEKLGAGQERMSEAIEALTQNIARVISKFSGAVDARIASVEE